MRNKISRYHIMASLVNPKNGFHAIIVRGKIVDEIKSLLSGTGISEAERFEPAIIEHIMNLVENYFAKNTTANGKVDKKAIVIEVLKKFVNFTPAELVIVDRIIEYIHSIDRVKVVSTLKKIKSVVTSSLPKDLL
jgi:hypothetical protein